MLSETQSEIQVERKRERGRDEQNVSDRWEPCSVRATDRERAKSMGTKTRDSVVARMKKWYNHNHDAPISA